MEINARDLLFFKAVNELYALSNGAPNIDTDPLRLIAEALSLLWQRLDEMQPPLD